MRRDRGLLTPRADDAAVPMPRTLAALLAGAVAIALNTAALAAADLVPLATAHGGLLRLLVIVVGRRAPNPDRRHVSSWLPYRHWPGNGAVLCLGLGTSTARTDLAARTDVRRRCVACQRRGGIAGDGRGFRWKPPSDAGWHGLVCRGAHAVLCCVGRTLRESARWACHRNAGATR
jgi:hypothetical protein